MRDWHDLVRQRLKGLALHSSERDAVHTELAAHLEDSYESLLRDGVSESEAARQTFSLANDWQDLRQRIDSARSGKDTVTNRVKELWLPGLLTFTLSMVLMELAQKFGPRPIVVELLKGTPVLMLYPSWLMLLPLAGALGGLLSKRAGGSPRMVLVSSVFPVLPYAVVFMIAIPAGLVLSHVLTHHVVAVAFFTLSICWVLVPGVTLLAGGLLVRLLSRPSGSHHASLI